MENTFPQDFVFGTATASYQIEGAANEDGRCPSIWDTFSHTPGATLAGDTGDVATDSYHRWREDLALLKDLGVDAYRFSIAMPRIMPTPNGVVNDRGLDFYERIVDALLESGIKPVVTLYHWDLPQYLGDEGGWLNRKTAYALADYTSVVANRLGDRVDTWTALNEPWCSSYLSYGAKEHAPGLGLGPGAFPAVHHLNLAHGLMVQAVRAELGESAKCSVTLNLALNRGDADACHRLDLISNRAFLDPMLRGRYPDELFAITKGICDWSFVQPGDLEQIHQSIDVLGINYYSTNLLAMGDRPQFPQSTEASTAPGASDVDWLPTEGPHTDMGWNIDPDGLHDLLVRVHDNYPEVLLMVTENGMACKDQLVVNNDGDKAVHDADRIDYLQRHLAAARRAMSEGVPLTGYFVWSLLDNFEWYFGYAKRFGITYVDYATQERIPKDSFLWYRDFIASRS
ncbi:GH1 family beta-glucosidase [Bifidobacterium catenulatum]|uniref:GH1 family beta-glucosidase n=1 Tax=Bifidobacterium catenulatum TaxID=1686 RepID=UPI0024810AB4|nr:GH1 family beta-glucosidase [Bifidobacterium catenulatum]MDH7872351.1 GH1 family beta-glucosidase [Bifidobacterium catenulatum subsp. kashiwanohense]